MNITPGLAMIIIIAMIALFQLGCDFGRHCPRTAKIVSPCVNTAWIITLVAGLLIR